MLFFFQLRYLQTLTAISAEKNSTIIFPLPIELCSHLMDNGKKKAKNSPEKLSNENDSFDV